LGMLVVVERSAGHFIVSWGWRRLIAAFSAGALSALAMAPLDFFAVLFVTMPVMLWLMEAVAADPGKGVTARIIPGFATGWWFGFGYFLAGMWWIGNAFLVEAEQFGWMLPIAVVALPAGLACFYGVGAVVTQWLWREDWRRPLALGVGLSLGEVLRGHLFTGFPWNTIGYGALTHEILMQKASLLGLYGVTALAVVVFSAPGLAALYPGLANRQTRVFLVCCALLVAADLTYGWWRLRHADHETVKGVSLRLVQPAIDQSAKWSPETEAANLRLMLDLSAGGDRDAGQMEATLLLWPESAFPFILAERPDALSAIGAMLAPGTQLVSGALREESRSLGEARDRVYNSVLVIDDNGVISAAADKVHLVPFGEYLPFQYWSERVGLEQLTHLRGGFTPGRQRKLLNGGDAGRFLPLICYEAIFPGVGAADGARPDWILNITNDAWFGMSPGPHQHWRQTVIRGVEEGLPVVRVANSGISSTSDPYGRIVAQIPLGRRGVADSPLPRRAEPTLYSRHRNRPFWTIVAVLMAIAAFPAALTHTTRH
jgi:apolipoprotein N-acyltransferase